ncbi:MBL fold metallo-hydrolase [Streptomyces sp. NPDC004111]|uniref:MBL fold metallo-hydrolase n=1 Tax=Streptomyces sp. NPDC004111 TaxID=3364690 RepID=UPI0036C2B7CA
MDLRWEELGAEAGWEHLAPGVARRRLPGWDATVGLVAGACGALLFDTGSTLREGASVRREAEVLLGRRVTHIALSHSHFDHVLGTGVFAGVEVFAAVGMDTALTAQRETISTSAVRHGVAPAAAVEAADLLTAPHHLVSGERTLDLGGGRTVLLANLGPAHSRHDLVALVPGLGDTPEVVFCGDLVEESGDPQAGSDAVTGRWPESLDRLLALGGESALYVPGHGAAVDAAFVRAQRDALAHRFRD